MGRSTKVINKGNSEISNKLLQNSEELALELVNDLEEYLKSKKLLELKDLYDEFARIKDFEDIDSFKSAVLKQVLYILKYGSSNERVRIIGELLKYLFPTKRDINLRHSGNIYFIMNQNIMGDVSEADVVEGEVNNEKWIQIRN